MSKQLNIKSAKSRLILDLGNNTGWCYDPHKKIYGHWENSKEKDPIEKKLTTFDVNLTRLLDALRPEVVIYEKPAGGHYAAMRRLSNYEGLIILHCAKRNIKFDVFSPATIKAFAGGGRFDKDQMCRALKLEHKIDIDNEHAIDAIWGYFWSLTYEKKPIKRGRRGTVTRKTN